MKQTRAFFLFFFIFCFLDASCKDSLVDLSALINHFNSMNESTLMTLKKELDENEASSSFKPTENYLLRRWLVEENLKTDRAEASKEALVDYYFELFHNSQDLDKFKINHPLVYRVRLIRAYRDL